MTSSHADDDGLIGLPNQENYLGFRWAKSAGYCDSNSVAPRGVGLPAFKCCTMGKWLANTVVNHAITSHHFRIP
jgi:hypothetical protein